MASKNQRKPKTTTNEMQMEVTTEQKLLPLTLHRDHLSQAVGAYLMQYGYMKEDGEVYSLSDISFEGDLAMVNGIISKEGHGG